MQAYVNKDRAAIEALLDDDYHFTSPIDNALDRGKLISTEVYFGWNLPHQAPAGRDVDNEGRPTDQVPDSLIHAVPIEKRDHSLKMMWRPIRLWLCETYDCNAH